MGIWFFFCRLQDGNVGCCEAKATGLDRDVSGLFAPLLIDSSILLMFKLPVTANLVLSYKYFTGLEAEE